MQTNTHLSSSRIEVVDAIRGIAVAMIILLHSIEHFNLYNQQPPALPLLQLSDQMIWDGLWFAIGGKAYAIFALLFGFSFYIMDSNAARRGQDFRLRFCWRMFLLFCFGCLNAAFFCGEVLVLYSIVGVPIENTHAAGHSRYIHAPARRMDKDVLCSLRRQPGQNP